MRVSISQVAELVVILMGGSREFNATFSSTWAVFCFRFTSPLFAVRVSVIVVFLYLSICSD